MRFALREREIVTGAVAGVTAFIVVKKGIGSAIPAIGPITPPIGLIILGLAIASFIDGEGMTGDLASGIGFGLIAAGAVAL